MTLLHPPLSRNTRLAYFISATARRKPSVNIRELLLLAINAGNKAVVGRFA